MYFLCLREYRVRGPETQEPSLSQESPFGKHSLLMGLEDGEDKREASNYRSAAEAWRSVSQEKSTEQSPNEPMGSRP